MKPRPPTGASGRQRHEQKITVYLDEPEVVALEETRLLLRRDYGLSFDRGRIVREAVSLMIADFRANRERSAIARRLCPPPVDVMRR